MCLGFLKILGWKFCVQGFGFWFLGLVFGFGVLGFSFWVLGSEFGFWDLTFEVE